MATAAGSDLPAAVRAAVTSYLGRLESGDEPMPFPRFRRGREIGKLAAGIEVSLDVDTRAALEREAQRQEISLEALLVHAVLIHLAERDRDQAPAGKASEQAPALSPRA
jgi:hypothetical protein